MDLERADLDRIENYINDNYEDSAFSYISEELGNILSNNDAEDREIIKIASSALNVIDSIVNKNIENEIYWEGLKYYSLGLYDKFDEDHIWIQAAGIAFYILICAIPFSLILTSILGLYLSSEGAINVINNFLNSLVGYHVSAESPKYNTTDEPILGVTTFRNIST